MNEKMKVELINQLLSFTLSPSSQPLTIFRQILGSHLPPHSFLFHINHRFLINLDFPSLYDVLVPCFSPPFISHPPSAVHPWLPKTFPKGFLRLREDLRQHGEFLQHGQDTSNALCKSTTSLRIPTPQANGGDVPHRLLLAQFIRPAKDHLVVSSITRY